MQFNKLHVAFSPVLITMLWLSVIIYKCNSSKLKTRFK